MMKHMNNTPIYLICGAIVLLSFAHCKNDSAAKAVPESSGQTEQSASDSISPAPASEPSKKDDLATEDTVIDQADELETSEISGESAKSVSGKGASARLPVPPRRDNNLNPGKPGIKASEGTPAQHGFTDVAELDKRILLDIRYATANNFTHSKIYDCPRCLLRPEAAAALADAHKALQRKGYGFKMFDCYRPRPYQQRLWDKVPNPDYVTPPSKGSMHSRGAAVDLTLVDAEGKELDMGTPYDFFGRAAHTDHNDLPAKVLENRKLLRETLEAYGFRGIRTEWWHFSYQGKDFPLSDYVWPCAEK
jgi:zinc D-Ala-D-Ala dipeptidase